MVLIALQRVFKDTINHSFFQHLKVEYFGPLQNEMTVSKQVLPFLVRQTAINANRKVRYATHGYKRPFVARQEYIHEHIVQRYKTPKTFQELMIPLFPLKSNTKWKDEMAELKETSQQNASQTLGSSYSEPLTFQDVRPELASPPKPKAATPPARPERFAQSLSKATPKPNVNRLYVKRMSASAQDIGPMPIDSPTSIPRAPAKPLKLASSNNAQDSPSQHNNNATSPQMERTPKIDTQIRASVEEATKPVHTSPTPVPPPRPNLSGKSSQTAAPKPTQTEVLPGPKPTQRPLPSAKPSLLNPKPTQKPTLPSPKLTQKPTLSSPKPTPKPSISALHSGQNQPSPVASPKPTASESFEQPTYYPLAQLQDKNFVSTNGLDGTNLEKYLSDTDFETAFKMTRQVFGSQPPWKKNNAKRALKLI